MAARCRIGVDLGGTKLAAGVVDAEGRLLGESVTHDHAGLADEGEILALVRRNVDAALGEAGLARDSVKGLGILFPGHIRWPEGLALTTSNLPCFKNYPLRRRLEELLGLPVLADNDANGQTLGEYRFGAGRGSEHMVFMTVSTGVGGGIIIDGHLYRGASGTAGEFGHMIVDASGGQLCGCGNRGCLMGAASGLAMPEAARRAASRLGAAGLRPELPAGCLDFEDLDGPRLSAGFHEENELCHAVVEDFARYIGIGLYNVFQLFNPQMVVLGGGLLNLPDFFFEGARKRCYELAGGMMYDRMEIVKGSLGAAAGVLGAAALFEP
jgi:glucokinase